MDSREPNQGLEKKMPFELTVNNHTGSGLCPEVLLTTERGREI